MSRPDGVPRRYQRKRWSSTIRGMMKQTSPTVTVTDADAREKLHIAKVLLGGYAAVSVLTFLAIVVFSGNPDLVTSAVWIRGSILAVAAPITFALGVSMAKGSRSNHRRVRIITIAQVVAILVLESIPG